MTKPNPPYRRAYKVPPTRMTIRRRVLVVNFNRLGSFLTVSFILSFARIDKIIIGKIRINSLILVFAAKYTAIELVSIGIRLNGVILFLSTILIPTAIRNWKGLMPEERWWLYTMTNASTGHIKDKKGWRIALRYALCENPIEENPQRSIFDLLDE